MITDQTMHQLNKWQSMMHCPDGSYAMRAKEHWDSISKPLDSLGVFEHQIVRIAACTQNVDVRIDPARLIVMCADNGIVNETAVGSGRWVFNIFANLLLFKAFIPLESTFYSFHGPSWYISLLFVFYLISYPFMKGLRGKNRKK